jgi:tRNA(Ile)-lysidine synthase
MITRVMKSIKEHKLLRKGETVCVAVSGGVDSCVLLDVLSKLSDEFSFKLIVAHLNHGLRGRESARDMAFVKKLAKSYGVPFKGRTLKSGELKATGGEGTQEQARILRLAFLEDTAQNAGASHIALGHNSDDRAETFLMRALKGAGLKGLSGIAPKRGIFIRPLIDVSREEIEQYAKLHGIKFVLDSSNKSKKYLRNSLRLELIPYLEKNYNPRVGEALSRSSANLAKDDEYMSEAASKALERVISNTGRSRVVLKRRGLIKLHPAIAARVFILALSLLKKGATEGVELYASHIYASHIKAFSELILGKRPNARLSLPGGLFLIREYDDIILTSKIPKPELFDLSLNLRGETVIDEAGLRLSVAILRSSLELKRARLKNADPMVAFFDADKLKDLRVRSFKQGDRLCPMGLKGTKKLKDIFIDAKVPLLRRPFIPIIEASGEILWVVGIRQSEFAKVTGLTKRVLRVECL